MRAPISHCRSSLEELPSRLLLMEAPTAANGSRYRAARGAPRDLLMEALRLLLIEILLEVLQELLEVPPYELHIGAP